MLRYGYLAKAYKMARSLLNALPRQRMNHMPRPLAELFYPRLYPAEIAQGLDSTGLSPYFVMGLMRQESILDDQIQSPAGARGLLQIMTYTGKELAKQVGYSTFENDWLYNPLMGVQLGVHYVKSLYEEYGDLRYVLTNYNAGPKPTKRWIRTNGDKNWETQVEEVSYRETRDYVKKVLGNFWSYQMIWEGR